MPTYEYECTRCGQITEEFKAISAPKRQRCPACRGKVERLISGGTGLVFKGSGFYINDSRKAPAKESTSAKESAMVKTEAKPSSGSKAGDTAKSGKSTGTRASD